MMVEPDGNIERYNNNNPIPYNDFCTVSVKKIVSLFSNPPFSPVHAFPLPPGPKCCQPFSRRTPRPCVLAAPPLHVVGGRIPCGSDVGQDDGEETQSPSPCARDTSFRLLTPTGRPPPAPAPAPPSVVCVRRGLTVSSSRALAGNSFTRRAHEQRTLPRDLEQHPFTCRAYHSRSGEPGRPPACVHVPAALS